MTGESLSYQYCNDNPAAQVDPSGEDSTPPRDYVAERIICPPFGLTPVPCPKEAVLLANTLCAKFGGLDPTKKLRCFVCNIGGRVFGKHVYPFCRNSGDCDALTYQALTARKNARCNVLRSCQGIKCCPAVGQTPRPDCDEINLFLSRGDQCISARRAVMNKCFKGGDPAHRNELNNVQKTRKQCAERFLECKC